jgi:hypothetical protein
MHCQANVWRTKAGVPTMSLCRNERDEESTRASDGTKASSVMVRY